ncbi:hypothetical protein COO60DRAFT_1107117 [Scenedesmus sp. NREL 46B-D3]|nr:hypothetical protein COO60DRAFT_1107117 [Scenedesmus sp. NREL 46B-D3]
MERWSVEMCAQAASAGGCTPQCSAYWSAALAVRAMPAARCSVSMCWPAGRGAWLRLAVRRCTHCYLAVRWCCGVVGMARLLCVCCACTAARGVGVSGTSLAEWPCWQLLLLQQQQPSGCCVQQLRRVDAAVAAAPGSSAHASVVAVDRVDALTEQSWKVVEQGSCKRGVRGCTCQGLHVLRVVAHPACCVHHQCGAERGYGVMSGRCAALSRAVVLG